MTTGEKMERKIDKLIDFIKCLENGEKRFQWTLADIEEWRWCYHHYGEYRESFCLANSLKTIYNYLNRNDDGLDKKTIASMKAMVTYVKNKNGVNFGN